MKMNGLCSKSGCAPGFSAQYDRTLSRREFGMLASRYGFTAAAVCTFGAAGSLGFPDIVEAAADQSAREEELKRKAEVILTLGMEGTVNRWPQGPVTTGSMQNWGCIEFKETVQQNSGQRVYVDLFDGAPFGAQTNALRKVQQGVFQVGNCSSQNAAALAPVWNVLDFPYQIGAYENMWKVMFSPEVAATVRRRSAEANVDILFNCPWLRWLELGRSVRDEVRDPAQLEGLKIRVTNSRLEQTAFQILPANPTPVAWPETFGALKSGAVDGIHVGPAPTLDAGLGPVVAQMVDVEFMYNNDATWINVRWLQDREPAVREAILEAAYETQVHIFHNFERMLREQTGIRDDTPPSRGWREYEKDGLRFVRLSPDERDRWKDALSPERNRNTFDELIERFGAADYQTVVRVANEPGMPEPQRWWKT